MVIDVICENNSNKLCDPGKNQISMSYIGTAHKRGHNAYQAIKNAISGHPDFIFE